MMSNKIDRLKQIISDLQSVLIGFSGGVDSTLLAKLCLDILGPDNVWVVTADSISLMPEEFDLCRQLADDMNVPANHFVVIQTEELKNPQYVANPDNRCFFCKDELFGKLTEIAAEVGAKYVVDGSNASDLGD